jgi:hypothetical protein
MIELFDVEAWLDDRGIDYDTEGKNVSSGWIGINCPFCGDDPSNHLGINLTTKRISCWRCGTNDSIKRLIVDTDQCSWSQANRTISRFIDPAAGVLPWEPRVTAGQVKFPEEATKEFAPGHIDFLESRGFDPDEVVKKYDLYATWVAERHSFSIIAPIYHHHEMMSFVARDVLGFRDPKYVNASKEESVMPAKTLLYNADRMGHTALVVEGITDVWRIGDGAVATFGTMWTVAQVAKLSGLKHVYVLFDADEQAQESARNLCNALALLVNGTTILKLDKGDPADMPEDDVRHLKREIFGR